MLPNWIFVITADYKEFKRRINEKKWPIFKRTAHRHALKTGDRIIFYQGGRDGQKFLGCTTLASEVKPSTDSSYYVTLSDTEVWKNTPLIRPMIPDLTFLVRKDKWGVHLQGGVITLFDKDYKYILSKSE